MTPAERAERLLAAWRLERERGGGIAAEALIARHPDLADELRRRFAALALLDRVVAESVTVPRADPTATEGRVLGDYRLVHEIGRGGMGAVYEAEQISMRRRVALKVLYPSVTQDAPAVERFRREAQAAGSLHHTNIVPVYGMGCVEGTYFYAMERIHGRSLHHVVEDLRRLQGPPEDRSPSADTPSSWTNTNGGPGDFARVARAFAGVADALALVHAHGIVHRDVKPSNLLLDEGGILKLVDFGLARVQREGATFTRTGSVLGTPAYMSPEQARGRTVDARTDVYSLGATLYEVLTLHAPHEDADAAAIVRRVLTEDPVSPRRWVPRIPRDLETIVQKAMEREPGARYASAKDMARDLSLFAEGGAIQARRIGPLARTWRRAKRHRRVVAGAAALVVACAVAAWALVAGASEREQRSRLEYDRTVAEVATTLVSQGWFDEGFPMRLPTEVGGKLRARLDHAASAAPERSEAVLLAALQPEVAAEERLRALDARHQSLPRATWRWARAYLLRAASRFEEAAKERALATGLGTPEESLGRLFEGWTLLRWGEWSAAAERLDKIIDDPVHAIARPLALAARAFAREQVGNLTGALEDYGALEGPVVISWPAVRMRMVSLWRRLGKEEQARTYFAETLAGVRSLAHLEQGTIGYLQLSNEFVARPLPWAWWDEVTKAMVADLPARHESWAQRARCLYHGPEPDYERIAELQEKAVAGADNPGIRQEYEVHLAGYRLKQGKPIEALAASERALAGPNPSPDAATQRARALLALGKKEEALAQARALAVEHPTHRGLHGAAWVLKEAGATDESLAVGERAVRADPSCVDCLRNIMHIHGLAKRYEAAEPLCKAILTLRPDDVNAIDCLVQFAEEQGRWEENLFWVQKVVALQKEDPRNWHNLANALIKVNRPAEALPAIRHSMEIGGKDRNGYRVLAECLKLLGRTDEAVAELQNAIAADVADEVVWAEVTIILLDAGRFQEALDTAEKGLERYEDDFDLLTWRVAALRGLERREDALKAARRILALDESRPASWTNVALLLDELGRRDDAVSTAREGVKRTGAVNVRCLLGELLMRQDRRDEARAAWEPLLTMAPDTPDTTSSCARAVIKAGTLEEAIRFVEAVDARWGRDQGVQWAFLVAGAWRSRGRPEDAAALASRVAEGPPLVGVRGAWLLFVAGRREEAAQRAAVLGAPESDEDMYLRACLYALLGRREDALEWLRRAARDGAKQPEAAADPDFAAYAKDPEFVEAFERLR